VAIVLKLRLSGTEKQLDTEPKQTSKRKKKGAKPKRNKNASQNDDHKAAGSSFWRCGDCQAKFEDKRQLIAHVVSQHGGQEEANLKEAKNMTKCEPAKIKRAKSKEEKGKVDARADFKFPCAVCQVRFRTADLLRAHVAVKHVGEDKKVGNVFYAGKINAGPLHR